MLPVSAPSSTLLQQCFVCYLSCIDAEMEMIGGITDNLLKKNSNTQVCEAEGDGKEGDTTFLYL